VWSGRICDTWPSFLCHETLKLAETLVLNSRLSVPYLANLSFLLSAGIESVALWAGHSSAIWRMCPANWNLSPTVSGSRLCPVRFSTSVFVTLSFQVTLMIFRKFRWWNTSIFFCILLVLFHVSLAYMAVDTTTAVYSCSLVLNPRKPDFHTLSGLVKTVAAFASRVFTSFCNIFIFRYDTTKVQ